MINKSKVVNKGSRVFYGEISNPNEQIFYFKGTFNNVEQFKNKIRVYYATEIDPVDAYYLRFNYISNVCKINGVDDGKYINV